MNFNIKYIQPQKKILFLMEDVEELDVNDSSHAAF